MVTIHLFQSFTPCSAPHIIYIYELLKDLASSLRAEDIQTEMSQFDPSTIHPCLFSLCPAAPQIVNVGILHEDTCWASLKFLFYRCIYFAGPFILD